MEKLKKARNAMRIAFDKLFEELTNQLVVSGTDYSQIMINYEMLDKTYKSVQELDEKIFNALIDDDSSTEDNVNIEVKEAQEYLKKFTQTKVSFDNVQVKTDADADANSVVSNVTNSRRKLNLPKIEIKKFGGDIKEWLPFWSQFSKIDQDEELAEEDKFQYLLQAITPNTRARELVESYPPTAKNYTKVINSLKARFGRDELLVEVYVRELLRLVLCNVIQSERMQLCTLYDKLETQLRALESLGVTSDTCAAMLFPLVESALPEELLRAWQRSSSKPDASMKDRLNELMKFLQSEVEGEERISLAVSGFGFETDAGKMKKRRTPRAGETISTAAGLLACKGEVLVKCVFCAGSHASESCFKAQKLDIKEKKKKLMAGRCCFACLKSGHAAKKCTTNIKCIVCSGRHVTLMCPELDVNKTTASNTPAAEESLLVEATSQKTSELRTEESLANQTYHRVLLQTLLVVLRNDKIERKVRVLIDTGSQRTYIRKQTAVEMGYSTLGVEQITRALFGGTQTDVHKHNKHRVRLASLDGGYACSFEALDQPMICSNIAPVNDGPWIDELRQLKISIYDQDQQGPIEVLIGADVAGKLLTGAKHILDCGLVAVETSLGWTLMGKVPEKERCDPTIMTIALFAKEMNIEDLWKLDVLGIEDPGRSKSRSEMEQAALQHFQQTVVKNPDGRYEVEMPWVDGHAPLPNNINLAYKRLDSLLRKLKSEEFYEEYQKVLNEWLTEGVIEEVEGEKLVETSHYLPHRHVIKVNSTTRLRPVFDASAREKNQPSLNQCLEKGINTIELIPNILNKFRLRKIGVVSDIRKAFLQISLCERDRDYLRFFWIDETGKKKVYRHARVVFGVPCSPFLLGAVIQHHLQQTLEEIQSGKSKYSPDIVQQLITSFYVDNCVTSVADESQLKTFIKEATEIMKLAKFELRGWEYTLEEGLSKEAVISPVLGIIWNREEDTLQLNPECFKNIMNYDELITKRKILSMVHRLFDPVGFSCPASVGPKQLLQQTWQTKIGWDVEVDENMKKVFRQWLEELHHLEEIKIPRWVAVESKNESDISLHTFCDASQTAFAAAVFLRSESKNTVNVQLIQAKSRITPMKKTTIPRLELLAATIGARLSVMVRESLNMTEIKSYWWTDSTTVLAWIQQEDQWTPFVWNRVQEIRQLTNKEAWRHIPGTLNPADLPSRGCSPKQLMLSRWWEGPAWLKGSPESWPTQKHTHCDEVEINAERKKGVVSLLLCAKPNEKYRWYYSYFSTYWKTVKVIGWILRFVSNCRIKQRSVTNELSVDEVNQAEETLLKIVQKECFTDVKDMRLKSLCPFEDEAGLIRIKTKISSREDNRNFRYPIVLPGKHPVIDMLIRSKHEEAYHMGVQGLLSRLRENFWILGGRRTVRSVITKCVTCKRQDSKHLEVEPALLPSTRVRDAAVFEVVGVDLAGLLYLKGGQKAWVCLFTCAVYRAIHIELVTSLSTDNFLQAFRRFVARRGRPTVVHSDNGTNFVGAENAFRKLDWNRISRYSTALKIKWIFNPPTAAWWGGWWERMIRIVKQLLRKVLKKACLSYEELITVLCDCEAVVNSRPLTYLSDDANDLTPLTPSVFLQEVTEIGVPDCDALDATNLNRRARYLHKLKEDLRQRFRSEYLGQLVHHCKTEQLREVKLDEVVLVGYDNKKRIDWPLARVIELIPGRDGKVRLVRLKTAEGELLRPLQRLYPLEVVLQDCGQIASSVLNKKQRIQVQEDDPRVQEEESSIQKEDAVVPEDAQGQETVPPIQTRRGRVVRTPKRLNL